MSPIEQMLAMLDEVMDDLMNGRSTEDRKGEARGIARCISAISCLGIDDVREYASYRYDARTEELEPMNLIEWAGLR